MILRIKELLKEKKITTYQLAEKLGTTQSAVSQAMNGNPNVEWLNRVAQFLGVPITELFESKGDFVAFVHHEGETRHFNSPNSLAEYIRPMCEPIEK